MKKSKWKFVGVILVLGVVFVIHSKRDRTNQFGRVISVEEICNNIKYIKEEISSTLCKNNYVKRSVDSSNINLLKNSIEDRTVYSWYEEVYVNEKGTLITITYSVEYSILWFEIQVDESEGDDPIEEYKLAISFYKEYTNGNISENRIYKMLEKKKSKIGEYRIDSWDYPDVFVYKVDEKDPLCTFILAGIVS